MREGGREGGSEGGREGGREGREKGEGGYTLPPTRPDWIIAYCSILSTITATPCLTTTVDI